MKPFKAYGSWVFLFFLSACARQPEAPPQLGGSGIDVGSGGDGVAIEFRQIADSLVAGLRRYPVIGIDPQKFAEAVAVTRIVTRDRVESDGEERDAVNFRRRTPPVIEVSRPRWAVLRKRIGPARALVFHEYCGVLGVDDHEITRAVSRDVSIGLGFRLPDAPAIVSLPKLTGRVVTLQPSELPMDELFSPQGFTFTKGTGEMVLMLPTGTACEVWTAMKASGETRTQEGSRGIYLLGKFLYGRRSWLGKCEAVVRLDGGETTDAVEAGALGVRFQGRPAEELYYYLGRLPGAVLTEGNSVKTIEGKMISCRQSTSLWTETSCFLSNYETLQ